MGADLALAITAYPTLENGDTARAGDELAGRVKVKSHPSRTPRSRMWHTGRATTTTSRGFREMLENAIDKIWPPNPSPRLPAREPGQAVVDYHRWHVVGR